MTMKERLAMFEANARGENDKSRSTQLRVTVLDEGNIKEVHEKARLRGIQGLPQTEIINEPDTEASPMLQQTEQ